MYAFYGVVLYCKYAYSIIKERIQNNRLNLLGLFDCYSVLP